MTCSIKTVVWKLIVDIETSIQQDMAVFFNNSLFETRNLCVLKSKPHEVYSIRFK